MQTLRLLLSSIASCLLLVAGACHHSGRSNAAPEQGAGTGTPTAPNGADPKQPAVRGTPTATIPFLPAFGVPTLGVGVGGYSALNPMQGLATTVFAPTYTFSSEENSYERLSTDTTGTRVHSSSNSFSVGVSGGFAWFSAGVRYRESQENFLSNSSRDFQGSVRLLKQRNFISLAPGHVALNQDVQNRLAAAAVARQAQNWTAVNAERVAFEQVYGIGFVSEVAMGHSMHMRAYCDENISNTSNVSSLSTEFSTPFVSGSFSNLQVLNNLIVATGCTVQVNGLGLVANPTSIGTFYSQVANFYSNLAAPTALWAGCVEYRDLPGMGAIYDPIPGSLIASANATIATATLQLPTLNAVGELVSQDSYSASITNAVWLSPYLFAGDYTSSAGTFTLQVRPFDLLKFLSRDTAFQATGANFLAARGYPVSSVCQNIVMPAATSGPGSEFPEHAGNRFYKSNVQQIRPVLHIVQQGTGAIQPVPADNSHWRLLGPMNLGNFGGPGTNTCGLFFGSASLSFQFADLNGDIAAAAQSGRLRLGTEAAIGTTSILLSQLRPVTGQFEAATWTPDTTWSNVPSNPMWSPTLPYWHRTYPGSEKAVLVRFPINWGEADPVIVLFQSPYGGVTGWGGSLRIFNWQESQDVAIQTTGYWYPQFLGVPVFDVLNQATGQSVPGSAFSCMQPDRAVNNAAGFGSNFCYTIYGNRRSSSGINLGTYQDILLLGQ